ncbi:MAG: hypothetical protein IJY25_04995 [Bacilli bacterium]|nr:hypothetical protein [Bacilli bacterium]
MLYNFKEYKPIFDTPAKREQELAIARKIMDLLNKNKYDNLEEFIKRTNSYQDFLKNNNMTNVVKHFGNTLNEEDFTRILETLRILTKDKQDFEKDNIKTTDIEDKQFVSYQGQNKTYFIDNSRTDKSIENQMKDLQPTQQDFQTSDIKQNTENMFKELEQNKKENLKLHYLHEINFELLNNEQKELFQAANNYQQTIEGVIRVDLEKGIMVDEENTIMKIEKENGEYVVKFDNDSPENEITEQKNIGYQKQLRPNPNTIYSSIA